MVVAGDLKGEIGSVKERDTAKERALVQLDSGDMVTLRYDDICSYTGESWD